MSTTLVNRRTAAAAIADRLKFRNSGTSLTGGPADAALARWGMAGRLNDTDAAELRAGLISGAIVYVVLSYSTPIAWAYADGRTFVTAQRFSTTTSGHQTIARVGLEIPAADPFHERGRALLAAR